MGRRRKTPPDSERISRALEIAPCSLRALARKAGVPHSTLVLIRQGKRQPTRAVAEALVGALLDWVEQCTEAVSVIQTGESAYERRRRKGAQQ